MNPVTLGLALVLVVAFLRVSQLLPALGQIRHRRRTARAAGRLAVALLPGACAFWGAVVSEGLWPTRSGLDMLVGWGTPVFEYFLFLSFVSRLTGLHLRDDVMERDNAAAGVAIAAGAVAVLPLAIGMDLQVRNLLHEARIDTGNRYGFWLLSTLGWLGAWLVLEHRTRISRAITIDRDMGAGLRLAAFLIATAALPWVALAADLAGDRSVTPRGWAGAAAAGVVLLPALWLDRGARSPSYPLSARRSWPVCAAYLGLGAAAAALLR